MSDSDDTNSRRAARPSSPPFRGPAGPGSRPPLTPAPGTTGAAPSGTPGKGSAKQGSPAPLALPPTAGRGRPATPSQGGRRPAATPGPGTQRTVGQTPPAGARVPST